MKKTFLRKPVIFKTALCVILSVMLAVSFSACAAKEPITTDTFNEYAEKAGLSSVDVSEELDDYEQILNASVYENEAFYVEFLECDSNDNATVFFNEMKAKVELHDGGSSATSNINTNKRQKYTLKTSEKYFFIERIENTFIHAYCDKSDSKQLDEFLKELGY